ncbi:MAG TPA: metalloregulator ArsR/SmtB family transcription factor [Rhizomicrobium sp.]|nr:metalloregulator ArsR/SmtB family transcription factor [Rhizomicrobium sp.]
MRRGELERLRKNAGQAAEFLLLLANDKRLLILCELMQSGEVSVGALSEAVGLSQSALSQHLAKLRTAAVVETRRESQTIYYKLVRDSRMQRSLKLLKELYCK